MIKLLSLLALIACTATAQVPVEPSGGYALTELDYRLAPAGARVIQFSEQNFTTSSFAYLFFIPADDSGGKFAFSGDIEIAISDTSTVHLVFADFFGFYTIAQDTMRLSVVRSFGRPAWVVELPDYIRFGGGLILGRRSLETTEFDFRYQARYVGNDSIFVSEKAMEILEEIEND